MELAEQTQLTQQMISKLESGTSQSTSAILSIAKALGVSAYWLWLGDEEHLRKDSNTMLFHDHTVAEAWLLLSEEQQDKVRQYILQLGECALTD